MILNRLKGFFSCGQLLGCCTNGVQGIWVVTEARIVLTSQPGLCRPTEAVNVFVWDCCRFMSTLQSLFLYSFAQLSCALLQEVCKMCISSSLPPKTEHSDCTSTAVQIGRAGRALFPSPPGSTRQGQGQPLLFSSRPGHLFCTGGGGRNQGSKLPLLVRRNQYLAIKPGEACLGITAWTRGFQYCHRRWNKRKTFWIYSLCIEAFYYSSVSKYKLREWFVSNKLIKY